LQNNENKRYIEEDEIDLKELIKTLWDKKLFIIIFTSVITVIAIIYSLSKTPIYETKALVEIGKYKNGNSSIDIDNASQLVEKLNVLFIDMYRNDKNREFKITSISIPKKQKTFLEIKSEAISNELAIKGINSVVSYIQKEHQNILDDVKKSRELEIKNLDAKIENIKNRDTAFLQEKIDLQEKNIKEYNEQLNSINKNLRDIENLNPSLAALKLMEKRDLSNFVLNLNLQLIDMKNKKDELQTMVINDLLEKRNSLESMLLPHNYKNTEIVGKIITNDYPVKPKKKLIVVVAFVTGFILSIFLVFFINFIKSFKEENQNDTPQ
jgi:LPS O-antigen subunit length determinant protein (WzzB/FepE family)